MIVVVKDFTKTKISISSVGKYDNQCFNFFMLMFLILKFKIVLICFQVVHCYPRKRLGKPKAEIKDFYNFLTLIFFYFTDEIISTQRLFHLTRIV